MPPTVKRRPPRGEAGAASRAEARRRARRAPDTAPPDDIPTTTATEPAGRPQPSGLRRLLLPPVAPLPGKPDPLAGFSYSGPAWLRAPATAAHLLRAQPPVWLAAGLVWAIARLFETPTGIGLLAAIIEFGALIGAGYLGWQRPWLYGLAAGFMGVVFLFGFAFGMAVFAGADPVTMGGTAVVAMLVYYAPFYGATGALAGWFGGYWRRRLAEAKATASRQQAARRRRT